MSKETITNILKEIHTQMLDSSTCLALLFLLSCLTEDMKTFEEENNSFSWNSPVIDADNINYFLLP